VTHLHLRLIRLTRTDDTFVIAIDFAWQDIIQKVFYLGTDQSILKLFITSIRYLNAQIRVCHLVLIQKMAKSFGIAILLFSIFAARQITAFTTSHPRSHHLRPRTNAKSNHRKIIQDVFFENRNNVCVSAVIDPFSTTEIISSIGGSLQSMGREEAEQLAGPFFGASLFPYLAFLWFLARDENQCPKGVTGKSNSSPLV